MLDIHKNTNTQGSVLRERRYDELIIKFTMIYWGQLCSCGMQQQAYRFQCRGLSDNQADFQPDTVQYSIFAIDGTTSRHFILYFNTHLKGLVPSTILAHNKKGPDLTFTICGGYYIRRHWYNRSKHFSESIEKIDHPVYQGWQRVVTLLPGYTISKRVGTCSF